MIRLLLLTLLALCSCQMSESARQLSDDSFVSFSELA
jgi:hypothetical protein